MKRFSGRLAAILLAGAVALGSGEVTQASSLSYVMNEHKDWIITECRKYGIWPSLVVGMAGVESGVASLSGLAESYNNYWGHTYSPVIAARIPGTGRCFGAFAAYPSFEDGVRAHLMWFWQSGYGGVQGVLRNFSSSPADAYSAVVSSGYMTGTAGYAAGIYQAVAACGAEDWDREAFPEGRKFIPFIPGLPCSEEVGEYDYPADRYNPYTSYKSLLPETFYADGSIGQTNVEFVRLSALEPGDLTVDSQAGGTDFVKMSAGPSLVGFTGGGCISDSGAGTGGSYDRPADGIPAAESGDVQDGDITINLPDDSGDRLSTVRR